MSALQHIFGTMTVAGYWFHYAQAVVKRLTKIGLRDAYAYGESVRAENHIRCLLSLYRGVACLLVKLYRLSVTFAQRLLEGLKKT